MSRNTTSIDTAVNVKETQSPMRVAAAGFVGTLVEWYDYYIYGTAAALVFSKLIFPQWIPRPACWRLLPPSVSDFWHDPSAVSLQDISETKSGANRCSYLLSC